MIARLPPVMQVAYVVEDLAASIEHWASVLRVGPFFVLPHVAYKIATYRGQPSALDISLAFAFSGDLQIELVQQHNEAPSVFKAFRDAHGFGVQHVGAVSERFDADAEALVAAGRPVIQHLVAETGAETMFFESARQPGETLELIRASDRQRSRFAEMKRAADTWDGATALAT